MSAPDSIRQLVQHFEEQRATYRSEKYKETQVRSDFLDPFFEALGWDVANRSGYAEKYREVIQESSVEVGGQAKAADYAFRLGDKALFLLEAKKPAVNIETHPEPAFQVRRYGWSAKLAINILSNFEQLAVYDCRSKPKLGDPPSLGRVKLVSFREYVEKWDEISAIFARQAALKGSFDQFADGMKGKRGTTEVDDAFLEEMERWRLDLARSIALRNPALSSRQVNTAVQTTIDRIIFLRICEERGIEAEDALRSATDGIDVYQDLVVLFKQADQKYNSGLFHFSDEKGQSSFPDTLTLNLKIDDKVLKDILAHLYYPLSPYAFKYISVDILGQVYERFLGKVIRLTAGHQAKVEEKPEVRKAGGVYYTPTYIVKYIVQNTLGELLKDQNAPDQKIKPVRVLDPACGSGSFLLGAYQYLLDWYLDWYSRNEPARWARGKAPALIEGRDGWQLTMDKKKEILLNHIYGVDIDAQAVEVTKLSLLLRVVENPGQLSWLGERILPDLGQNIKCGNSLIGPDYYNTGQMPMFGDEESYRVNVFDWHTAFPQVFAAGGFDAVVGNPPYIRSQLLDNDYKDYYSKFYSTATGTYDIYVLFVEKSIRLMHNNAKCGFILPNKFFTTDYGEGLRRLLGQRKLIEKIVDFEDAQIFEGAGTYTNLLFIKSGVTNQPQYINLGDVYQKNGNTGLASMLASGQLVFSTIQVPEDGSRWTLASGEKGSVLIKLQDKFPPFLNTAPHIFQGLKTSADKVYMLKVFSETETDVMASNLLGDEFSIEKNILKPVVKGEHIQRYETDLSGNLWIIYPYRIGENGKATILSQEELISQYPKAWIYLTKYRKTLGARDNGVWAKRKDWYAYARSQNIGTFLTPKFLVPYMTKRLRADFNYDGLLFFVNITTGGYGLRVTNSENPKYLLGLINSKLLDYCIKQMTNRFHGGYFAINKQAIERLPYKIINFSDPADAARHARMVKLVEGMLALHKRQADARLPQEKEMLQRQIQATDGQIDRLVYELYGLTEEEIKIVEGL